MRFSVDIAPPEALSGLTIRQDLGSGVYALVGYGHRCILREWTWGERRRLLAACSREAVSGERASPPSPDGDPPPSAARLDRQRFITGLLELLTEPMPEPEQREIYASAVLWLLGITPEHLLLPCTAAELTLATRFGWAPEAIERQSAVTLDRWLAQAKAQPDDAARLEKASRATQWNPNDGAR